MRTSVRSLRRNHPYRVAISAALRQGAGARGCNPRHRTSEPGAPPRLTPHAAAADCKSALLAAAVLLACLATPLRADVIDDFSGPKKFLLLGLGGATGTLVDGQLKLALLDENAYAACSWERNYLLLDGRPVEFRVDLVKANSSACYGGLGVGLQCCPVQPSLGRIYFVRRRHGSVALTKYQDLAECEFLNASVPSETEPVTMSLTLTRLRDSLRLGVKVVLRDQPDLVIFEREVTDGPGRDPVVSGIDPGPPLAGPVIVVGLNFQADSGAGGSPEVVFDNLVCSEDPEDPVPSAIKITRQGEAGIRLDWNGGGIPVAADTILGPWRPCPEPIVGGNPFSSILALRGVERFYRLVQGSYVEELFNGAIDLWEIGSVTAGGQQKPRLLRVGSQGARIQGTGENDHDFLLRRALVDSGRWYQDCVASLDIAGWVRTMGDAALGVVLRAKPLGDLWSCTTEGLPDDRYAGLLTFKKSSGPSESALTLTGPRGDVLEMRRFPAVDPARQYRLRFWAVGDRLTLELFDLADPETPVVTCAASDGRISKGMVAIYGTRSSAGTYEVTINRFLLSGVMP